MDATDEILNLAMVLWASAKVHVHAASTFHSSRHGNDGRWSATAHPWRSIMAWRARPCPRAICALQEEAFHHQQQHQWPSPSSSEEREPTCGGFHLCPCQLTSRAAVLCLCLVHVAHRLSLPRHPSTRNEGGATMGEACSSVSRNQSSPVNQYEAGPSDAQSFSDTIKSRLQSVSTKYKDSITKSTRGWKERWFTQNNTISNLGSEMRREVSARIAAVSRMIEKLETRDGTGPSSASPANVHPGSDADSQGAVVLPTPATALHNASPSTA